jgi:hypothetical protein
MMEPKPFASLSSGLLARKGAAKPAMRPQGFGQFSTGMEDLGWDDMGNVPAPPPSALSPYEEQHEEHVPSPIAALTPMGSGVEGGKEFGPAPSVVEQQQAAIEATFGEPAEDDRPVLATKARKAEAAAEPEAVTEVDELALTAEQEVEPEIAQSEPSSVVHLPRDRARRGEGFKSKAAFTLRLEAERHLKLRLACAVSGRSAQHLLTEALDEYLSSKPEINALAGQLPAKTRKTN